MRIKIEFYLSKSNSIFVFINKNLKDNLENQIKNCLKFSTKFENLLIEIKEEKISSYKGIDFFYKFLNDSLEYLQSNFTIHEHWNLETAFRGHILRKHWNNGKENYEKDQLIYMISKIVKNLNEFISDLKKELELSQTPKVNFMKTSKTFIEIAELVLKDIEIEFLKTKNDIFEMWVYEDKFGFEIDVPTLIQVTDYLASKSYFTKLFGQESGLYMVQLTPTARIKWEKTRDTIISLNNEEKISTHITNNYNARISNSQINTNSSNNTLTNISNDIGTMLDKMIEAINSTNQVTVDERKDLIADIAIIKHEIAKSKPNKSWLMEKIEFLNNFSFLLPYTPAIYQWLKAI